MALRTAVLREGQQRLPSDEELAALLAAEDERTMKWEAVLLPGSGEVVVAAGQWHEAVLSLERIAAGKPSDLSLAQAIAAMSQARRGSTRRRKPTSA